jgi:hypothetical protein
LGQKTEPPVEKATKGAAMDSEDILTELDELPEAGRIRSRRLADGVATIVADATGLSSSERNAL